ncbi:hypothetical protein [Streptomyces sp. NBC_00687]|uniref:hypothetical protein n=1 Tax=Streptomyces sp. NBC_00687 TaxID=2975807 RepID=UPI00224DA53F|nr:hypothetical protein [Streptomyces sp. NBC_00687]MCX4919942.1 hypothetical protein [Streptomyces sp. NBC_00687]
MGGTSYWTKEVRRADRRSAKEGATRRLDRLRGLLQRAEPAAADRVWREVASALQRASDRYTSRGSDYWITQVQRADRRSSKDGASVRLNRLRGVLQRVDPVVANRAWRELADDLQKITDRHTR